MTAYLQADDVNVSFGGLKALNACSFTISQGRITCLVGPNGAGKTTIFNVITGFLRPDSGTVSFQGTTLDGMKPQAIVAAGIARTFQNLRLFVDLTALDNVVVALPKQSGVFYDDVFYRVAPHVVVTAKIRARPEQSPQGAVIEGGKCVGKG